MKRFRSAVGFACMLAGPAGASSLCEQNFRADGNVDDGLVFAAADALPPGMETKAAVEQMRTVLQSSGMEVQAPTYSSGKGEMFALQKAGSGGRKYPVMFTADKGKGTAYLVVKLLPGMEAKPDDMRKGMCDTLAAVAAPDPSDHTSAPWYKIHATGTKPNRSVFYARESRSRGADPNEVIATTLSGRMISDEVFKAAEVLQVFESPDGPGTISTDFDVRCDKRQVRAFYVWHIWRDGRAGEGETTKWRAASDGANQQLTRFLCDRKNLDREPAITLMGVYRTYLELDKATWKTFWPDGKEVVYTTTLTKEQLMAKLDKLKADIDQKVAAGMAELGASARQQNDDMARTQERQHWIREATRRRSTTPNPILESWIGASESALLQAWGQPNESGTAGDGHYLSFNRGYQTQTPIVQNTRGAQAIVGYNTQTSWCVMRFLIRRGKVETYDVAHQDGDQCRKETFPPGPYMSNAEVDPKRGERAKDLQKQREEMRKQAEDEMRKQVE